MIWLVKTTARADADFQAVLRWTETEWGARQSRRYAERLTATLERLEEGPMALGAVDRSDLGPGMRMLRMIPSGTPARHVLLFRAAAAAAEPTILILRILQTAMDPAQHLAPEDDPA